MVDKGDDGDIPKGGHAGLAAVQNSGVRCAFLPERARQNEIAAPFGAAIPWNIRSGTVRRG
jgi:hypothetical protein